MTRLTHADWREIFPGQQDRFHRFGSLSPTAAILFHIDRIGHSDYRQFQWFESLDELAGYMLHVVQWTWVCDLSFERDVLMHRDELAAEFVAGGEEVPSDIEDEHRRFIAVASAIGGPRDELVRALDQLPRRMGALRIFPSATDAMLWFFSEFPVTTEMWELDELERRTRWLADARDVQDEAARSRTAARFWACSAGLEGERWGGRHAEEIFWSA